ncbi:hypothetical protein Tco_0364307 [Tanacetum coccineum]
MIGALMYLRSSRSNIIYATCLCARYQAKPTEKHLKEVKKIFRYLRGTVNMGLWYTKDFGFELTGFLDSDYAGCQDSFKSTSSGTQFLGEKLLVIDYGIPRDVRAMLLKKNQTVFDSPLGFVGLYTHSFTLFNLRIPLPKFFCEVLNYFKVHISCFNPFRLSKLTTFFVMCKAYGGEPNVDLLRAFLNLGPTGNWLTLSNRGGANDVITPHVREDPLYNLIANYLVHVRTFSDPIVYLVGLKTSWEYNSKEPIIYYHGKEMDFNSFMMEGIDGEFHFLPKEDIEN